MRKILSFALAGSAAWFLAANAPSPECAAGGDAERLPEPLQTISAIGRWLGESATVALFGSEAAAIATDAYGGPLIENGSFEEGEYPASEPPSTTLPAYTGDLDGWAVDGDGVDWHNGAQLTSPQDGSRVIDLNTSSGQHGTVSQGFLSTEEGYTLTFYLAGPIDDSGCNYPNPVGVRVTLIGLDVDTKDFYVYTSPITDLQWGTKSWKFKPDHYWTQVVFSSLDGTCDLGPLIDNVSVVASDPPAGIYYSDPYEAENTGPVTLLIYGIGFSEGASVQLKKGSEEPIPGSNVTLKDATGSGTGPYLTMEATFDLTDQELGSWDLVVTNTDGPALSGQGLLDVFNGVLLHSVAPATGANIGHRTILIHGEHFVEGMNVKLSKDGETDIEAMNVSVIDTGSAKAIFSLNGENTGVWDVTAWKPDDDTAASTLKNAFVIRELEAPPTMVVTVGGNQLVRAGRLARYIVTYMNKGDVDLVGVPIVQGIPAGAPWKVLSKPETYLPIPDSRPERGEPHVILNDLDPDNPTEVLLFPITNVPAGMPARIVIQVLMENEGNYVIKATWDEFRL